jgi:hypothetical protein
MHGSPHAVVIHPYGNSRLFPGRTKRVCLSFCVFPRRTEDWHVRLCRRPRFLLCPTQTTASVFIHGNAEKLITCLNCVLLRLGVELLCGCKFHNTDLLIDYLPTWITNTIRLHKLKHAQLMTEFSALYGIRKFITVSTRDHHRSLSWAGWIYTIAPYPISLRTILILSSFLLQDELEIMWMEVVVE